MGNRSRLLYKSFWLIGNLFLMLIILGLLSACQNDEVQPVPTLIPVAAVEDVVPKVLVETAVSIPLVPTFTPEAVEVVVASEQTVMTLWHSWQESQADALAELITTYEANNPGVKLALVYQANMADALQTAVPVGEGPDLILMQQEQLGRFAENGLVAPVTAQFDTAYLAERFSPAATAAMTWQDDVWGIPALQDGIAIVYNKSLMDESLIPEDSADFDSLFTNAIAYHEANPGSYLLCNESFSADSLDVYHAAPVFFGFSASEAPGYIDDWGNVFVNTPEKVAAGEWLVAFMEAVPPEAGYEICRAGFITGEFASWWTGSWALDGLDTDFEMGVRAFGRPFTHVTGLFLGTNAVEREHQALAANFMAFLANPEVQTNLAVAVNIAPAHQQALASDGVQVQENMVAFGEAAARGIPFPSSPYSEAQWQPMGQATSNMLNNLQSPADALAEAQTAVEQTIEALKTNNSSIETPTQ
jgi:arabinogalactan oligomer/maltooligosaccharide transport system substrate-binding protein